MYGLAGERRLLEWEVPWLPGYEGSRPVRIGNAAHGQLQLDVFGEVMDALHQARRGQMPESEDAWHLERALVAHLERVCVDARSRHLGGARPPAALHPLQGHGVGRARPRDQSAELCHLDGPIDALVARCAASCTTRSASARFDATRRIVHAGVRLDGGRREPPAHAARRLPPRRRTSASAAPCAASSSGCSSTASSIATTRRSPTTDSLPGEGAFLACTFWLVDNYLLQGRHAEARRLFDRLLAIRNDVGLLAEEYHPGLAPPGRQLPAGLLPRRAGEHRVQHPAVGDGGRRREGLGRGMRSTVEMWSMRRCERPPLTSRASAEPRASEARRGIPMASRELHFALKHPCAGFTRRRSGGSRWRGSHYPSPSHSLRPHPSRVSASPEVHSRLHPLHVEVAHRPLDGFRALNVRRIRRLAAPRIAQRQRLGGHEPVECVNAGARPSRRPRRDGRVRGRLRPIDGDAESGTPGCRRTAAGRSADDVQATEHSYQHARHRRVDARRA